MCFVKLTIYYLQVRWRKAITLVFDLSHFLQTLALSTFSCVIKLYKLDRIKLYKLDRLSFPENFPPHLFLLHPLILTLDINSLSNG